MIALTRRPLAPTCMLVLTAGLAMGAQSCSASNDLYGSVSASYSLQYDSTILGVQQNFITISFLRNDGEVPAKLAIDTNGLALASGAILNGNQFLTHVTVSRVMSDGNAFRPVVKGSINFNNYAAAAGGALSGHFAITFDSGDLLEGDFSGNLVDQSSSSALLRPRIYWACRFDATAAGDAAIPVRFNEPLKKRAEHAYHADRMAVAAPRCPRPRPPYRLL